MARREEGWVIWGLPQPAVYTLRRDCTTLASLLGLEPSPSQDVLLSSNISVVWNVRKYPQNTSLLGGGARCRVRCEPVPWQPVLAGVAPIHTDVHADLAQSLQGQAFAGRLALGQEDAEQPFLVRTWKCLD